MASKTRAQVRSAFAARLATLSGWTQSRIAADAYGRDANSILHKGFSVGVGDTVDRRESGYRGRPAEGLLTDTQILVHFGYQLVPKEQHASRDLAEAAGQELIVSLMAYDATWPNDIKVELRSVTSEVLGAGEWYLGSQTYNVVHTLPLL